jgi:hypothetical protein
MGHDNLATRFTESFERGRRERSPAGWSLRRERSVEKKERIRGRRKEVVAEPI